MKKKLFATALVVVLIAAIFIPFPIRSVHTEEISITFHYHRPDGDYTGWNLWVNDPDGYSDLDRYFQLVDEGNGDRVATVPVDASTERLYYRIRLREWEATDFPEEQYIDLTDIHSGTLDFYIQSGVMGGTLVQGDDVHQGVTIVDTGYNACNRDLLPEVIVTTSAPLPDPIQTDTFQLTGPDGPITIDSVRTSQKTHHLILDQPLDLDSSYTITFQSTPYALKLPQPELPRTITVYAMLPSDWEDPTFYSWPEAGRGSHPWPGKAMHLTNDGWYRTEVSTEENTFLIHSQPHGMPCTVDITFDADHPQLWVVLTSLTEQGKWDVQVYYQRPVIQPTAPTEPDLPETTPQETSPPETAPTEPLPPMAVDTDTFYVHVPQTWATPYIYSWPEGGDGSYPWPGQPLTQEDALWYTAQIPSGERFIINDGATAQTPDLSYLAPNSQVWVIVGGRNSDGLYDAEITYSRPQDLPTAQVPHPPEVPELPIGTLFTIVKDLFLFYAQFFQDCFQA